MAASASLLASCAEISGRISARIGHHTGGVAALPASEGWAELPVGRWLHESGVTITGVSFCRPEICVQPGFAARMRLDGRERAVIRRIIERPETLAARPTADRARGLAERRQGARPQGRTEVARLTRGDWSGALFALRPGPGGGNPAHIVILAREADSAALIAAAAESRTALAIADAAIWW